jgi:hypothetical protein
MLDIPFDDDAKPRQTLDELRPRNDSSLRPYNVLVGRNLGNITITLALPMYQFFGMSAVASPENLAAKGANDASEVAQRKLDPQHARKLALFFLRALIENTRVEFSKRSRDVSTVDRIQVRLGKQPYFAIQPIVANLRGCGAGGSSLQVESVAPGFARVYLSDSDVLWVIDGQHRRFAMDLLFEFLKEVLTSRRYPKKAALYSVDGHTEPTPEELEVWNGVFQSARQSCNVVADVHLGLTAEQERQVFHDLNNLSKPVSTGLAFQFDSSNPVNMFIKEELIEGGILRCPVVEKDITDWHQDDGAMAYKDLVSVNARLIVNKTSIVSASPTDVVPRLPVARRFWAAVAGIPNWGVAGAKSRTVAAQSVVLKSAAKVTYDLAFGREASEEELTKFLVALPEMDLTHANPCWRFFGLSASDRASSVPGLDRYMPQGGDGANRDIGGWDDREGVMRFGAKHNDIFPIVGDMMRWMCGLPNRRTVVESSGVTTDG